MWWSSCLWQRWRAAAAAGGGGGAAAAAAAALLQQRRARERRPGEGARTRFSGVLVCAPASGRCARAGRGERARGWRPVRDGVEAQTPRSAKPRMRALASAASRLAARVAAAGRPKGMGPSNWTAERGPAAPRRAAAKARANGGGPVGPTEEEGSGEGKSGDARFFLFRRRRPSSLRPALFPARAPGPRRASPSRVPSPPCARGDASASSRLSPWFLKETLVRPRLGKGGRMAQATRSKLGYNGEGVLLRAVARVVCCVFFAEEGRRGAIK